MTTFGLDPEFDGFTEQQRRGVINIIEILMKELQSEIRVLQSQMNICRNDVLELNDARRRMEEALKHDIGRLIDEQNKDYAYFCDEIQQLKESLDNEPAISAVHDEPAVSAVHG